MFTPSYFDEKKSKTMYVPETLRVIKEAEEYRDLHVIKSSFEDTDNKTALFIIDPQNTFCNKDGELFVEGAEEDMIRLSKFIYENVAKITSIHFSLDTHTLYQIFHPSFWIETATGRHPSPMTIITVKDIDSGTYKPALFPVECRDYVEQLEQTGKYSLMLWPYHGLLGTVGHAIASVLYEAAVFHATVRTKQFNFETKGTHPLTENYSVLSPEVKKVSNKVVGQFNTKFFQTLMSHDRVYIGGEASSHCVLNTIEDLLREIKSSDPDLAKKVYILKDCMSPVGAVKDAQGNVIVDFPKIAEEALARFSSEGMNIVESTDPVIF